MFIDVHAHAYDAACPPIPGSPPFATAQQVLKRYDDLNIEKGFVLPLIGPEYYLPQSNEDVLEMCAESGGRLLPFCNIDPRAMTNNPDAPLDYWLRHYRDRGCLGIGEVMPNLPFLDPRCQNLFKHVEAVGLPLIFDISDRIGSSYGFYDDPGLPQLGKTLQTFPKLLIFGHGPAFWAEIGKLETHADRRGYPRYRFDEEGVVPKLFRRYENLCGDLSAGSGYNALARHPDYAVSFLTEFQDRLFFGTDICNVTMELPLAGFLLKLQSEGRLSADVSAKIARGNAQRLFGI